MAHVVPKDKYGSVITVPAATKVSTIPPYTTKLAAATWVLTTPTARRQSIQAVARNANNAGKRPANSLMPNNLNEIAWAQKDKGGLPQKGTPGSNHGVIQSLVVIIKRAISAYLGSVVSANGTTTMAITRTNNKTPNNQIRLVRCNINWGSFCCCRGVIVSSLS